MHWCANALAKLRGRIWAESPGDGAGGAGRGGGGMTAADTDVLAMDGHAGADDAPDVDGEVVVRVRNLSKSFGGIKAVDDVSFEVRAGEILGLAGLIGSGRSEVARAIFGADRAEGEVVLDGRPVDIRSPRAAIRSGVAMLPEDRKHQGLLMQRSLVENVSLPHLESVGRGGVVFHRAERRSVSDLVRRLDVRTRSPSAKVATLSGGNQQKTLFAKWLFRRPRVLLADEPTRGVDVGAKRGIYELIQSLAAQGMAVLLIAVKCVLLPFPVSNLLEFARWVLRLGIVAE